MSGGDLVSVIIPAYNAEKYLKETLNSVLSQFHKNWEIIIIDDGSTDKTAQIADSYLKDVQVKLLSQENKGVSAARNKGIKASRGDYIAFLDADDIWEPDNLSKKLALMNSNKELGWTFCDMQSFDDLSGELTEVSFGNDNEILRHLLAWDREVVPGKASNLVLRRACFEDGLLFDESLSTAADQDFCIRLASKYTGKHVSGAFWRYRVLSGSMSRNIAVMEKDHIAVFRKARELDLFGSYLFMLQCFSNLYLILAGSWWKEGGNKGRGILFLIKAFIAYPGILIKLIKKNP